MKTIIESEVGSIMEQTTEMITTEAPFWPAPSGFTGDPPVLYFSFDTMDELTTYGSPSLVTGQVKIYIS